jgi:hypothetical protein
MACTLPEAVTGAQRNVGLERNSFSIWAERIASADYWVEMVRFRSTGTGAVPFDRKPL